MKISVIGCGYLGAAHAACMAKLGHQVIGIDVDEAKVSMLAKGRPPFFEPGLPALLTEQVDEGHLTFSTAYADAAGSAVHFICVGTPQSVGEHTADLRYVNEALDSLIPHLAPGDVVVGKSTVPVGTAESVVLDLAERAPGVTLIWNPEFLRESHAIVDTLTPDRFVYGIEDGPEGRVASTVLDAVYATPLSQGIPRLVTDLATAQLVKVAANSFLATKISFINAVADVCAAAGADVTALADAIGLDRRIGRPFLDAGIGYGGGCLPKDTRAFVARAEELGVTTSFDFLHGIDAVNLARPEVVSAMAAGLLGGSVEGRVIAILGAAFKPNTDDVRDSPALAIARRLHDEGARVTVTDPQAIASAKRTHPEFEYFADHTDAVVDAELVLLLTEWPQYLALDPRELGVMVNEPRIIDGRNALDPQAWRDAGWTYASMGRP